MHGSPYEPKSGLSRWLDSRLHFYVSGTSMCCPTRPPNLVSLVHIGGILTPPDGADFDRHHAGDALRRMRARLRLVGTSCASNSGWMMRNLRHRRIGVLHRGHIHMFRRLYYGSYKRLAR
jgi:hypothetical protein